MTNNIILSESLYQADLTATIDWGWKRVSGDEWENDSGERVRYISRAEQMQGLDKLKIYRGYGWANNREATRMAYHLEDMGRAEFIDKPVEV